MSESQHEIASEPHTVYVKFGPKAHQEISTEVAAMMLTSWRERDPAGFGAYLAEAFTGTRLTGRAARD